jgi:hypothetical protein
MMARRDIPIWAALAAVLMSAGPGFCAASRQPQRDAAPPWKTFAVVTAPTVDGKTVSLILTPGPVHGSWAAIVGGASMWQLVPIDQPAPPNPPGPNPPPTPPVPPGPAEAARKLAVAAVAKLPQGPDLVQDAQKLASVYKLLADQIPGTIDSIDKLITANKYAREIALGPQRAAVWEPWVKEVGTWLDGQRASGVIKTAQDCKPLWTAIGEGLASIQQAKK